MWELLWGLGSVGLGPAPSPAHPVPVLCSVPRWVPPLCPELKSPGGVNNRAVPSSPCTGRRPSQGGWCRSVTSLDGGALPGTVPKRGRDRGNCDRKYSRPRRSHGDPRCPATTLATADVRQPTSVPMGVLGRERGKARGVVGGVGAGVRRGGAA